MIYTFKLISIIQERKGERKRFDFGFNINKTINFIRIVCKAILFKKKVHFANYFFDDAENKDRLLIISLFYIYIYIY